MIIYLPSYYKGFRCIAGACRHSCCIGWEIRVDDATLKKYSFHEDIICHVTDGEICLVDGERCPFLLPSGLCRIISEHGEEYLSDICQRHPRFYHRIGERVECGIGLSCEEACRIILSSDDYAAFFESNYDGEVACETDFDSISHREYLYSVLKDDRLSYSEKMAVIKEKYGLCDDIHTDDEWNEILSSLEYLDESHRDVMKLGNYREENSKTYERFLAYLVFRHVSVAESYEALRARLGFCLLLLRLLYGAEDILDAARIISEEIEYSEENTDTLIFEFEALV